MLFSYLSSSLLAALALALTACGGSSGGSGPAPQITVVPPPVNTPAGFTNVTGTSGIEFAVGFSDSPGNEFDIPYFSGGVAAGDYDNDGDIDLFVVRGDVGPNLLYRNNGGLNFSDVAATAGLAYTKSATENFRSSGPAFADMDGDGDLDLFLGGVQGDPSLVFQNNGDGTFTDVTAGSGLDSLGAVQNISSAFGDYDADGDLDMLVAHWGTPRDQSSPGDTEHLWRNDSAASTIRFASVSEAAGISPSIITLSDPRANPVGKDHTFAPAFVHFNDDLLPDIAMVGDFNTSQVFLNNGNATFTNMTDVDVITETNGMGSALGDYDNDGDMDWFVSSIYRQTGGATPNGNRLYRNDGGSFTDVTEQAGVADGAWGWGACFMDFDNDGNLDLFHVNGWPFDINGDFSDNPSRAFLSDGNGVFASQATTLGIGDTGQGRGVVCTDLDNDGDTDLFLWSLDDTNGGSLYRNDSSAPNFLSVKLRGLAPNHDAIGARITARIDGETQLREVSIASNFVSHNPTKQLFGLGNASQIDALSVSWPDGTVSDLGVVQANQFLTVDHPGRP